MRPHWRRGWARAVGGARRPRGAAPTGGLVVARIVLQDFTGVPLLVDLAAMRTAVKGLGGNPAIIEPLVPVDLVVDHSVQVDFYGSANALQLNLDMAEGQVPHLLPYLLPYLLPN